jgi:energy-coupling factor transporter ATP-binding protein EcfA2
VRIIELSNGTPVQVAEYTEQDIFEYRGNPLIESLGPVLSPQKVIERLSVYPSYNKEERLLDDHIRLHFIQRLLHYYQPMPIHLQLHSSIDRLLRAGYMHRNPLTKAYAKGFVDNWRNIQNKNFDSSVIQTGQTLSIIGTSGVGKTRTLQRIFDERMIPQVISHTSYKNEPLTLYQVNFLKIETPFDGSVKTIIYDFMYQFDLLMGTNYFNRYANSRLSTSQLMPIMAQIAKGTVGCLIIDELQNLKEVKSKSSNQVLNFFTTLINSMNIPIIMISTPKGMDILQKQFRQARRNTNAGNVIWERLKKDEIWDLFIEGLWKYQWTREETPLSEEISTLLFYLSQGILDICVKLYMMCQIRCLSTGVEKITIPLIKEVYDKEMKIVHPMLEALRSSNNNKLLDYDDLIFPDIEVFLGRERVTLDQRQVMDSLKQGVERKNARSQIVDDAVFRLGILGISEHVARETVLGIVENVSGEKELADIVQKAFSLLTLPKTASNQAGEKDLRNIINQGKTNDLTAYQSLVKAGYIKQDYPVSNAS